MIEEVRNEKLQSYDDLDVEFLGVPVQYERAFYIQPLDYAEVVYHMSLKNSTTQKPLANSTTDNSSTPQMSTDDSAKVIANANSAPTV